MHVAGAALLGLLQLSLLRACQADAGFNSAAGMHISEHDSLISSEEPQMNGAASWGRPMRQLLQAGDAPAADWACPAGGNITDAARTAIMNGQPCVAAVGFPGRLRCGTVLANPKLVLDINFNLCKRITPVRINRHARACAVHQIASTSVVFLRNIDRLHVDLLPVLSSAMYVQLHMCAVHRKQAAPPPPLRPTMPAARPQAPMPVLKRSSGSSSNCLPLQHPHFSSHLIRRLPRRRLPDRRLSPTAAPVAGRRGSVTLQQQPHQLQHHRRQPPTWSWRLHLPPRL